MKPSVKKGKACTTNLIPLDMTLETVQGCNDTLDTEYHQENYCGQKQMIEFSGGLCKYSDIFELE